MENLDRIINETQSEECQKETTINETKKEINTICPKCNNKTENINEKIEVEFNCFHCGKCDIKIFIFILCKFCGKKIYFKKINNNLPINGMNGINIKCPYLSCGKYFYLTICPKCRHEQKIPKIINEGELIKCIYEDKGCGYKFIQIRCPIKDCNEISYFSKPKYNSVTLNGIIFNHKKENQNITFQKMSCFYCHRPIVYLSDKNRKNIYYDSMKIICPYSKCGKKYNSIICPMCFENNIIENGFYFMGHKIKCNKCKNYFGKILCPKCLKVNPLQKNFFKRGQFVCRYSECTEKSFIVNCIYCQRMNVFNKEPIEGQKIQCAYKEDCHKTFSEVYCPSCNELNPFPNGDFSFGKAYKCIYSFCNKTFQLFVCPKCLIYSKTTENFEGKKYSCVKCNTLLCNWECPYCKETIMDKDSTLNYGQMVRCPNIKCNKEYSFCRCYDCHKLIFSKENQNILGIAVLCNNCNNFSVSCICPFCKVKIIFKERMDDLSEGEKIDCSNCQKSFKYCRESQTINDDIYSSNLSILKSIKGETIDFGQSSIDENYSSVENSLIDCEFYKDIDEKKSISKKNSNLCIICHCNTKESIFYPCGHRCTCYKCAAFYFKVFEKCPRCDEKAEAIIPKLYEQF